MLGIQVKKKYTEAIFLRNLDFSGKEKIYINK